MVTDGRLIDIDPSELGKSPLAVFFDVIPDGAIIMVAFAREGINDHDYVDVIWRSLSGELFPVAVYPFTKKIADDLDLFYNVRRGELSSVFIVCSNTLVEWYDVFSYSGSLCDVDVDVLNLIRTKLSAHQARIPNVPPPAGNPNDSQS